MSFDTESLDGKQTRAS